MIPEGLQDTQDSTTDYSDEGFAELIAGFDEGDTEDTIVVPPSLEPPKPDRPSTPEPSPAAAPRTPTALGKRTLEDASLSPSEDAQTPKKRQIYRGLPSNITSTSPTRRPLFETAPTSLCGQPGTSTGRVDPSASGSRPDSPRKQKIIEAIEQARRCEPQTPSRSAAVSPSVRSSDTRTPDYRRSASRFGAETPESLPRPKPPSSASDKLPTVKADSPFHTVAQNEQLQGCPAFHALTWGVCWMMGRLVTQNKLDLDRVSPSQLDKLRGSNQDVASSVEGKLNDADSSASVLPLTKDEMVKCAWGALDEEDAAFKLRGDLACVENVDASNTSPFKYHGKVQFSAKLSFKKDRNGELRLVLDQPELGSSSRFTRRFGSDWLIRIRIHKDLVNSKNVNLREYFMKPFIFFDRVYRAFYASKERTAFLVATNETFIDGDFRRNPESRWRLSYFEILEWHNPLNLNQNQTMAKWAARIPLGLSNSVPGLVLKKDQIKGEAEIISPFHDPATGKPPSEMEMTDGCGYINLFAMKMLSTKKLWDKPPTAIQVRVAGAKGLLTIHPGRNGENASEVSTVWVRPSQTKIHYSFDDLEDPAKRTVDVLRASHMRSGTRLANEVVICLAENGVKTNVFTGLLQNSLDEIMEPLLNWNDMHQLHRVIAKEGGVLAARMTREMAGEARVRGLRAYDDEDEDDKDDEIECISDVLEMGAQRSTAWFADEISGQPSSLEETVCVLLDSGFTPQNNPVLASKLEKVIKGAVNKRLARCKVEVPMACTAFIIPDPFGVLNEGEIHIKSSLTNLQRQDGLSTAQILGPVLVTRNPCKLPSDIQKVTAVFCAELRDYDDVIVFSTKGRRSLASLLATGDYDGDKAVAIWQPEIVDDFVNADTKFADPPADLMSYFEKENETVADFLLRTSGMSDSDRMQEFQKVLLSALRDPSIYGMYSTMHDNAIYGLGYDHPHTIRLAYMFTHILDGAKTGLTVREAIRRKDMNSKEYGSNVTAGWKKWNPSRLKRENKGTQAEIKRRSPKPFIMDELQYHVQTLSDRVMPMIEQRFKDLKPVFDKDLAEDWEDAVRRAEAKNDQVMKDELEIIKKHVEDIWRKGKALMNTSTAIAARRELDMQHDRKTGGSPWTNLPIEIRQDILREQSRDFAAVPDPKTILSFSKHEIARLRASYAYIHDWKNKWSRHPFNVATRTLCEIKADVDGKCKVLSGSFYDRMMIAKSAMKGA